LNEKSDELLELNKNNFMFRIMSEWKIDLSSWIIQDGNYRDFHCGDLAEFALEFFPKKIQISKSTERNAYLIKDSLYKINGQIIFYTQNVWIIDFGIKVFQEAEPVKNAKAGDFVCGEIYLGVDPFFYFENLYKIPDIPPLIYTWRINRIERQTAPFIETKTQSGQRILRRDESKRGYLEIEKTNAWEDDNGFAAYLLHCTKLNNETKLLITRSIPFLK
jgi:hypothetical protein